MATFTGKAAGNWSAEGQTTWNEAGTPADGDAVILNGFAIVQDIAIIPAGGGTLLSITDPGKAGKLTVDLSVLGNSTINATTITCGTSTAGILAVSGNAGGATLTVNCTSGVFGGSIYNAHGCYSNHTNGTIIFNAQSGHVNGGAGGGCGFWNYSTGSFIINGDSRGGGGTNGAGTQCSNACTGTINGDSVGGTGQNACGTQNTYGGNITHNGNIINGTGGVGWAGKPPIWEIAGKAKYTQWSVKHDGGAAANTNFGPEPLAEEMLLGVTCGSTAGSFDEAARNTDPGEANVWLSVGYKILNAAKSGTKRASSIANCTAANVRDGVNIDDVTGDLQLPLERETVAGTGFGSQGTEYMGEAVAVGTFTGPWR